MTHKETGALLLLATIWGSSAVMMKIAAAPLGPVLLAVLRSLTAAAALLAYGAATRTLTPLGRSWWRYLVVGAANVALPTFFQATGALVIPASLLATLNATTPMFGAIVARLWTGERLTSRRIGGLLLGLAGVATLVGLGPVPITTTTLLASGSALLASLSYGVAANFIKDKMPDGKPQALATYGQLFGGLLMVPFLPFSWPDTAPSATVVGTVLLLAVLGSAFAFMLYFYLIVSAGPTKATMVTYLSPAFGMFYATLLLQEPLVLGNFAGFGLILASVALVNGLPFARRRASMAVN